LYKEDDYPNNPANQTIDSSEKKKDNNETYEKMNDKNKIMEINHDAIKNGAIGF